MSSTFQHELRENNHGERWFGPRDIYLNRELLFEDGAELNYGQQIYKDA